MSAAGAGPSASPDVIVVGGGIVGTSAAAFLAGEGARVVLVEREGLASGASGANSGVVQHPFDPVLAALYRRTLDLYRDLAALDLGFRLGPQPAGMLFVSREEDAARREAELVGRAFPSLRVEVAGGSRLRALEPRLAEDLWACRVDIGFPVVPGASTYAYATLAESRGVDLRQGRSAALDVEGERVRGVRIDGRPLGAASVLVAAGPWTSALLDPTGRWRPIVPRWGVVVEAELVEPPGHVLEEAGIDAAIGVPEVAASGVERGEGATAAGERATAAGEGMIAPDGRPAAADAPAAGNGPGASDGPGAADQVDFSLIPLAGASVIGSTFLAGEPDPRAWLEPILARAARFVPSVADAPIRGARACARPQSVDGRPLLGRVPGIEGAFVCAGHGAWGISTGPGSARLVADLILHGDAVIPAELDAARFGPPRS